MEEITEPITPKSKRNMKPEYPNRKLRSDKQLSVFYNSSVTRLENILSNNELKYTMKQNQMKQKLKSLYKLKDEYAKKVKILVEKETEEKEKQEAEEEQQANIETKELEDSIIDKYKERIISELQQELEPPKPKPEKQPMRINQLITIPSIPNKQKVRINFC
jgi:hypothetical protein